MLTVGIITASDKGYAKVREDLSGPTIQEIITAKGYTCASYVLVPDEREMLEETMIKMADEIKVDLILTTGGTGFSKRDVTPEATRAIIERETEGIAEAIRSYSLSITPRAMLSRGVAGIRKETLIINLPGSPKAVREILDYILESVEHGIQILKGDASECAR